MNNVITNIINKHNPKESFYIIDLEKIKNLYKNWISLLPLVKPYYAVKSNNNPILLKTLNSLGINYDCASKTEIKTILKLTNNPSKIIFANPCKLVSHLEYAKEQSVNLLTFDCEEELYKIKKYHPNSRLILRLAVDDSKSIIKFNIKFGCSLNNIEPLLLLAKQLDLNIVGFSFHVGSNNYYPESYYNAIKDSRTAYNIAISLGIRPTIIDIGGGFSSLNRFKETAFEINRSIHDFFDEEILNDSIEFIGEPGRYFSETTHTLVVSVIGKKLSATDNTITYTLNESIYNSFNCIIFDYCIPKLIPLYPQNPDILYKSRFFGYTCDSLDLISDNIDIPLLNIDDVLYIENFGAYTYAASSSFNGFESSKIFYDIDGREL
jgi:ornithine decarboxylase